MNQVTRYDDDDDGFGHSARDHNRVIRGSLIKWNESAGWHDRDGLPPPESLLVVALGEALQKWKAQRVEETITAKPLPSVDKLNETIPKTEWEAGLNGQPKPPWAHNYCVYLLDPQTASVFTYLILRSARASPTKTSMSASPQCACCGAPVSCRW